MSTVYELPVPTRHILKGIPSPEMWDKRKKSQIIPMMPFTYSANSFIFLTDEMHEWFVQMDRTYRLKRHWLEEPDVHILIKSKRTAMLYKLMWHGR